MRFIVPFIALASAKELTLYPRQDVYVEKQRPTWSYRTGVLQVGKTDSDSSEYRAFLAFDLSTVAKAHARVVSAKLQLHPLLEALCALLGLAQCAGRDAQVEQEVGDGRDDAADEHDAHQDLNLHQQWDVERLRRRCWWRRRRR